MTYHLLFKALAWLGFFAAITVSWVFYVRARNKERMALIEKGVDAPDAFKEAKFPWLKIGIVIIGLCLGVALVVLSFMFQPKLSGEFFLILMILSGLFFGGIAMVIAHYVDRKGKK
ncbi:MAG: hypothetical protein JRJ57_08210 [Deltaproteobacteria bacterium]|nr:hypothetical protein [Deltaproteobacteria bacterium]HDZ40102.1 hypothetical protein [Bacteroidota bacterium]